MSKQSCETFLSEIFSKFKPAKLPNRRLAINACKYFIKTWQTSFRKQTFHIHHYSANHHDGNRRRKCQPRQWIILFWYDRCHGIDDTDNLLWIGRNHRWPFAGKKVGIYEDHYGRRRRCSCEEKTRKECRLSSTFLSSIRNMGHFVYGFLLYHRDFEANVTFHMDR